MPPSIRIGRRTIGAGAPVYVIAEMSANHGQNFDEAVKIVHAAADAGADAIKLQTYTADTLTIDAPQEHFRVASGTLWAAMIVHECAHFVGGLSVINHFATEFPIPQGAPQDLGVKAGRNYQQLHTGEALRNASSYAAYAIHTATATDSRFGANNTSV